jgi:hypothetical protein
MQITLTYISDQRSNLRTIFCCFPLSDMEICRRQSGGVWLRRVGRLLSVFYVADILESCDFLFMSSSHCR